MIFIRSTTILQFNTFYFFLLLFKYIFSKKKNSFDLDSTTVFWGRVAQTFQTSRAHFHGFHSTFVHRDHCDGNLLEHENIVEQADRARKARGPFVTILFVRRIWITTKHSVTKIGFYLYSHFRLCANRKLVSWTKDRGQRTRWIFHESVYYRRALMNPRNPPGFLTCFHNGPSPKYIPISRATGIGLQQ